MVSYVPREQSSGILGGNAKSSISTVSREKRELLVVVIMMPSCKWPFRNQFMIRELLFTTRTLLGLTPHCMLFVLYTPTKRSNHKYAEPVINVIKICGISI